MVVVKRESIKRESKQSDQTSTCSSPDHERENELLTPARSNRLSSRSSNGREYSVEYLADLLKEQKQLQVFPGCFLNIERLVNDEISRVRSVLFQCNFSGGDPPKLPEPVGTATLFTEKVYVPVKDHPDFNFVGRILGPRGMTAKQLEKETGCKIMVRGKGSMRDRKKEDMNRGRRNWEHLEDELHVLIHCEETPNRAKIKLNDAIDKIKKLLIPAPEGSDELKRKQLMELALMNGTYRPTSQRYSLSPQLVGPISLFSPVRSTPGPILVSSGAGPMSPAPTSTPAPSTFVKSASPTVDYNMNMMMNQLNFKNASLQSPTGSSSVFSPIGPSTYSFFETFGIPSQLATSSE